MNHFSQRLAILAILVAAPVAGEAATYTVTPVFAGAFTNDGTLTPIPNYNYGFFFSMAPAIWQFDFLVSATGFAADQFGYANGVFTITPELGITTSSMPGWNPSAIPNVDSNGATPGGVVPLLSDNSDFAAQDLKDILIGVATPLTSNPAVDPRFRFGQGTTANINVGSVLFDYRGGFYRFRAGFTQVSALYRDGSTNQYIGIVDALATRPVAVITNILPEPATGAFAVIAILGAAVLRRD
jgi:hypothetical protein